MIAGSMRHIFSLIAFMALLAGTSGASAQVYKCVTPAGRTVYADEPCGPSARALAPDALGANTLDGSVWREQRARQEAATPAAATGAPAGAATVCPDPQEIRNLETRASSNRLQAPEREFLWAELRRARACSREDTRYTAEDWRLIREAQDAQTAGDPVAREAARRRAESIHGMAASRQEQLRMQTDREAEQQRVIVVPPPWHPPPLWRPPVGQRPPPSPDLACSGTVCTDGRGQRYDRQPDGVLQRRQDQARCVEVRGVLRCGGGFGP